METTHVKSVFTTVFVTLGVFFIVLMVAIGYFFVADPLQLRPMLFGTSSNGQRAASAAPTAETADQEATETAQPGEEFTLSEAQRSALSGLGIDPASIPATISPVQIACFEEALGTERVSDIRAGAVPSAFELLKVKGCIN